ncbi:hypothetical protein SAMN02910276_00839 [Butyrivibrio sp. Su6]|uniref:hypothetical protein n=1 Tax=Butyrivibrio sp. Su6 TaxID=1520810 RepID=UPI00089F1979|nr:hypothetical protein [Butyrivibrio sp. Su6]SEF68313.1 hypothetical protein SAMN02910276_00839 [Butyrivibrio sp. Su6]
METNIAQAIDITCQRARYDENVKELLADKQILARILKYTLDEFKDTDIQTIISNIDEPEISKVRVEPGHTNADKIKKCSEEDNVPSEGKIYFDIRFSVYCGVQLIKILINIEAQKSSKVTKLGYHLDNRVVFYLGRMISAQKEVEFTNSDYDSLKAVRSIWICMDAGDDEDSINRISLTQEVLFGKKMNLPNIDKLQGVIIRLRSNENLEKSKNILIAMLETLLKKEDSEMKKKKLSGEYGIEVSRDTERRLNDMCNLSDVILENGLKEGIEQGIEQGIEAFIVDKIEDGVEKATIIEKLVKRFKITIEKAEEYYNRFSA